MGLDRRKGNSGLAYIAGFPFLGGLCDEISVDASQPIRFVFGQRSDELPVFCDPIGMIANDDELLDGSGYGGIQNFFPDLYATIAEEWPIGINHAYDYGIPFQSLRGVDSLYVG